MKTKLEPKIKLQIKTELETAMYSAVNRRFDAVLKDIIRTNTTAVGYVHDSFNYKGKYYSSELRPLHLNFQKLDDNLRPVMDKYLADRKKMEMEEMAYVTGLFTRTLNASNSIEDYYRLLPECTHNALHLFSTQEWKDSGWYLPIELSEAQVEQFKLDHADWIMLLKKRMVLDLITI